MDNQQKNPLLFPHVISDIMKCLPYKDLKSCRLVCRTWEREAYRLMRGKHTVKVTNYLRVRDYLQNLSLRKDFADSYSFGSNLNIATPLTTRFFDEFGPNIKRLELHQAKWKEPQLKELLFEKVPNLENLVLDCTIPKANDRGHFFHEQEPDGPIRTIAKLKQLSININVWEPSFDLHPQSTLKTFLIDLFSVSPNLERITCPKLEANYHPLEFLFPLDPVHVNHFINGEVVDALDELNGMGFESNIRRVLYETLTCTDARLPRLDKLGEMDICMTLREEQLRKLLAKTYPLKKLDLTATQNVTMQTLHGILTGRSASLEHLKLRFLRRSPCVNEFPSAVELKKLKTLDLTSFKGSFEFIRHLQSLETLRIVKINRLSAAFPVGLVFQEPLKNVSSLEIFEEEEPGGIVFRPNCIRRLGGAFPNLKRLRLDNICDGTLRAIYESFPLLEELISRNGRFTDAGLTGFSTSRCQSILQLSNYDNIRHRNRAREELPIFSLKNLRVLDLNSKELTDVGIVYGVLQCRKLKRLTLQSYKVTDISIHKVVSELDLEYLRTDFCFQLTLNLVDFIHERLPNAEVSINEYEGPMKSMEMWKFLKRNNSVKVPISRLTDADIANHQQTGENGKKRKYASANKPTSAGPCCSKSLVPANKRTKRR